MQDSLLMALAKELNEKLHEPTANEERWEIIMGYLRRAYGDGVYDGKQEYIKNYANPYPGSVEMVDIKVPDGY